MMHAMFSKTMAAVSLGAVLLSLSMPLVALADGPGSMGDLRPLDNGSGMGSFNKIPTLQGHLVTIPSGTTLLVKLDRPISSYSSSLGESVNATLENDVFVNDQVVIPAGSEVNGQVTNVSKSGRVGKHGEIDVRFVSAKTPSGSVVPLQAHIVTEDHSGVLKGNTYKMDIAKGLGIAAGATGVGAILGTATGSLMGATGGGAILGTTVGGIAGVSYALLRQGKDVVIPSGSRISIVVDQAVNVNPNASTQ